MKRILATRRWHRIRSEDLARLRIPLRRALPFLVTADHTPVLLDAADLRERAAPSRAQTDLFDVNAAAHGEL